MIPTWRKVQFGEYIDSCRNGFGRRPSGTEQGPIVLRLADVSSGVIDLSNPRRVSMTPEELASYRIEKGDLLFVRVNGSRDFVGKCIIVEQERKDIAFNDHLMRVRLRPEIDSLFAYYLFGLSQTRAAMLAHIPPTSGGQLTINQQSLSSIKFPLPPLPEQRQIAAILGTWDEAIRLTAGLIAAKQQRKKGLMQRLLSGEVRFPGFAGRAWREVELADITEIIVSNVDKKLNPAEKSVRLCNYTDVFKNAYIRNSMTFMEGSATPAEINRFGLRKHDVIITKDSETAEEIAEAAVVIEDLNNVICGYHLAILRPDPQQAFGPFLNEMLHHAEVRQQFVRNANGITRYGLTQATIREATLRMPGIEEQMKISMVLQACDREINLLQQKLAALQQQKKGLMQRLLTGAVRVKISDQE